MELCGECDTQEAVKFNSLCDKLTTLFHGRSRGDRQYINSLLDEFNSLDFKSDVIENAEKAVLIVNQCCCIVPSNDTFLVAKGCQLFSNLILKQKVKVEGKTLLLAINWCLEAVKYCSDIAILDILGALEVLLYGNGNLVKLSCDIFSEDGTLMLLSDQEENDVSRKLSVTSVWDVRLLALRCLQSVTHIADTNVNDQNSILELAQLEKCACVFFSYLHANRKQDQNELNYVKILITCLLGLQNIFCQSKEMLDKYVGDALGIVKAYMLFGLSGHTELKPQKVFPSIFAQADLRPTSSNSVKVNKNSKVKLRNPRQAKKTESRPADIEHCAWKTYSAVEGSLKSSAQDNNTVATFLKTSESDYSDSETGQTAKTRSFQGRVRQSSQCLLQTIIKVMDKKVLFGYLSNFLPDGTTQTRTLMTCLLRDPSSQCRLEIINSLSAIFLASKIYFLQAERSGKRCAAFTPYSETVGNIIEEIHRSLCLALSAENSVPVIIQLLKCVARLVQNTPYHRLSHGLIMKVVRNTRAFLRHKDWNIQVASLNVLRSIICVEPSVPEIMEILKRPLKIKWHKNFSVPVYASSGVDNAEDRKEDISGSETDNLCDGDSELDEETEQVTTEAKTKNEMSWLLEISLENLGIELRKHLSLDQNKKMEQQSKFLCPVPVRVESYQVVSALCRSHFPSLVSPYLQFVVDAIEIGFTDSDTTILLHAGRLIEAVASMLLQDIKQGGESAISTASAMLFWKTMLCGPITCLVQNMNEPALRTAGCDCLANMTSDVFDELPREKQILIITLLFGCSSDDDTNVRAAAVRALAVYILFTGLRQDIQFVIDTAEAVIKALSDSHVGTRMKASWSLSNVSDALIVNVDDDEAEEIPKSLFTKILESAIKASRDNEKVRSSAVRAVGNLLRILNNELLFDQAVKENVQAAVKVLIHNASTGNNMKVRWNACYAVGNVLRNRFLYAENAEWLASTFHTLLELVQNFRNFKVRISAAAALAAPSTREQYGSLYINVWIALIHALENSHNMEDFNEYQHQDNLVQQICHTLIHLANLVSEADLTPLEDIVVFNIDVLQQSITRFQRNVIPEKTANLMKTADYISSFLRNQNLSADQKRSASLLLRVFSVESDTFL
ncbi:HEAT repeat-containing protein 6 [Schistocerca americana]|uniref:HEAT repeat-containing protein 6 n=1 Tax=Schistocerca americana TaxID=7009 RepID=UPI001F4F1B7A|nr:HEAT repeat-containing protein 6 [Schistocerca americana]